MPKKRNSILIYQDYVHNNGIPHRRLCETYGHENVRFCDADDIIGGALNDNVFLLVLPGGADLYYCEKLNGAGNRNIRSYVEQGGNYLGICAGAYYACREIDWHQGDIAGPRELGFFDGAATGPIYEYLEDRDIGKSWSHAAHIKYDDGRQKLNALLSYSAGPYFSEPSGNSPAKVIARYSDNRAAILHTKIGQGNAILSGLHIERIMPDTKRAFYHHNNQSVSHDESVYHLLQQDADGQRKVWNLVLSNFDPDMTSTMSAA